MCRLLAEKWISSNADVSFNRTDFEGFYDLQKIVFLNYLCTLRITLSRDKIRHILYIYLFDYENYEI